MVRKGVSIGAGARVAAIVRSDGEVRIGDHVLISHEVVIADGPGACPRGPLATWTRARARARS